MTKALVCGGEHFQLQLQVGNREMVFDMPTDPKDVLVRHAGSREIELHCGPLQSQELTVVYKPASDGRTAGVVAELVY